jgi:drug/metabolite transporter (DMT)-like permease
MDLLVPIGVAFAFFCLCWLYALAIRRARPLTPFMRRTLVYAPLFILGLGYLMMFAGNLHWPPVLLFPLIAVWGAVVLLVAWWRYRREKTREASEHERPMANN